MNNAVELPRPRDWQVFEDFCRDLFAAEWGDLETQKYGRPGQEQHGVDVYGRRGGKWLGVQCKRRRTFPEKRLSEKEVRQEVELALSDKSPRRYETLVIATTAPPDAKLQDLADELTEAYGEEGPRVVINGWDQLCERLRRHRSVFQVWERRLRGTPGIWNIPTRNPFFTGREDLLESLTQRLEDERSATLSQAMIGLGGTGKTQSAIEYCHRNRERYEHLIWLDASSPGALLAGYAELGRERKLASAEDPVDQAAEAFLRWLRNEASWLAVLDNVEETEGLVVPEGAGGHVLMTSRRRELGALAGGVLDVEVLPPGDATDLLLTRARRDEPTAEERRDAARLVEALGFLPLAIEQAGGYLAHRPIAIATYLEAFERRQLDVLGRQGPEVDPHVKAVATTWEVNLEQLPPEALEVMNASAFLAPDRIPVSLFVDQAGLLGERLAAMAEELRADPLEVQDRIVEPLIRFSLMRFDSEDGGALSIHRLTQEVVRRRLDAEGAADAAFENVHRAIQASFPQDYKSPAAWPACAQWLPHVESSLALWDRKPAEWDPTVLWTAAGTYAWHSGRSYEARDFHESALEVRRHVLGEEHLDTLLSMNELAITLRALGDASGARSLHESALEVRRRVLGEEHPDTLISMNNLAETLWSLGDASGARSLLESALKVSRRVLGEEHPDTLTSMNNMASTLRALGDASGARSLHDSALEVRRRVLGEEHPDTLISMNNLATTLRALGDASGARSLHESALEVRRRV
ncbi:MAG: FxSxx-COOH system tetratricopeptide repeat protein, partial [Acidobacteriota bacterium]